MVQSKEKARTVSIVCYINLICNLSRYNPHLEGWRSIICLKRVCLLTLTWWKEGIFWTFQSPNSSNWDLTSRRMTSRSLMKSRILLRNFRPQDLQKCQSTMEWWWIETSNSRGFSRGGNCCKVDTTICQSREYQQSSENRSITAKLLDKNPKKRLSSCQLRMTIL